jgi:hypothetical protein
LRVLFYHDPVPELGRPFLWKYFIEWSARMRDALPGHDCRFAMADSMRDWAVDHGVPPGEMALIREEELRDASGAEPANWNRFWFDGWFGPEEAEAAGDFVAGLLAPFEPDVVLTHSPAPFLRTAFPGATVLHYESGLLKFPPFPMSFYFDPDGFFGQSLLANRAGALRRLSITAGQQVRLDALRKLFLDELLIAKSPFAGVMRRHAGRFPRRILLPLQFNNFFGFDSNCPFRSQFEYARWVLERTPPEIGVVLTQHVYFERLEEEALAFLKLQFPNLIHEAAFDDYNTASQFLLADVDAVVTVTSSVGMQSLWWRKPLIAVGSSHLVVAADASDPADVNEIIDREWPAWKDPLLYWLLTHYYAPAAYVYSSDWLPVFFEKIRSGQELQPFDADDRVTETIAAGVIRDVGRPAGNPHRAFEIAAQERLEALEQLHAAADLRARLLDECRREADRRGQLLEAVTAEAERRAALIEHITAEADRRAKLIDELTEAVRARDERLARRFWR